MALLSYERHEGDVGHQAKVEDEVGGVGGEHLPGGRDLVHAGAAEETDDVGDQEEHDVHGDFVLTWDKETEMINTDNSIRNLVVR